MRRPALAALIVFAGLVAPTARAQQLAGEISPMEVSSADVRRQRAHVAWVRAAWNVSETDFQRAVVELEAARAEPGAGRDFYTEFMLAMCYARLSRAADCDRMMDTLSTHKDFRPEYPGTLLVGALRATAVPEPTPDGNIEKAKIAIGKLDEFLAQLDLLPPGAPFAPEFRFLGHFYRGRVESRLPDHFDKSLADLRRSIELSKAAGRTPATELVSLLARVYIDLKQSGDAKRLITDAIARDPANAPNYYNYGMVLEDERDDVGARKWYEAALARNPGLVEAHKRLAVVARHLDDLAGMLRHLESIRASYVSAAEMQMPVDEAQLADLECGLGLYWRRVGDRRMNDLDDAEGAKAAWEKAKTHFRAALAKERGCVQAITHLIQIASKTGAVDEMVELKKLLDEVNKLEGRKIDPFRSAFC